ncbi:hypothetical protein XF_2388 [Xylella fastidiosa 9a5c]|uniref:Uncharacterized protein n=1 Tax=Xylella fastidiosa (strain 9a5c) TaxID=160492 RepID=Q9PAV7_XYLFA|nr:hypothetical protein XF_2388 [Xylella fastidiosa 9a5c]
MGTVVHTRCGLVHWIGAGSHQCVFCYSLGLLGATVSVQCAGISVSLLQYSH